jgi:ABC-2 type transport system ATP-binding protein
MNAIHTAQLKKTYRKKGENEIFALQGIDLTVGVGEVFALLGRNGAGKTSLIRILTTLLRPTSGTATVMEYDVVRDPYGVRRQICAVLQENSVESYLSVIDNFRTFAAFHHITGAEFRRRSDEVIGKFDLAGVLKSKVSDLSGGVKRRVQVAKVFMSDSPVVFLDEPTTGMDPITKLATLDAIREQVRNGRTFLLTTHILSEAEELSTRIGLIDRGRLIAAGNLAEITALVSDRLTVTVGFRGLTDELAASFASLPVEHFTRRTDTVEFTIPRDRFDLMEAISRIARTHPVTSFEVHGTSLEDAYIELLGGRGDGAA